MSIRRLTDTQYLPIPSEQAWEFFSDPRNLNLITPPEMQFVILTPDLPERVYPGMIIHYKVSPPPGMRMEWLTEITHVEEGKFFVDDQRSGPYRLWHHQHHFSAKGTGTEMTDIVHYSLPLGFLGNIAGKWLVDQRVRQIFTYRARRLKELFPAQAK